MKKRVLLNLFLLGLLGLIGNSAFAVSNYTQFGRYLTVTDAPSKGDVYGLNMTVQRQFPESVQTVGQAIELTLNGTEYKLVPEGSSSKSVVQMYHQKLPTYLHSIGPISLKNALLTLSGTAFQLVDDPVHRLLTFKVRDQYQTL